MYPPEAKLADLFAEYREAVREAKFAEAELAEVEAEIRWIDLAEIERTNSSHAFYALRLETARKREADAVKALQALGIPCPECP